MKATCEKCDGSGNVVELNKREVIISSCQQCNGDGVLPFNAKDKISSVINSCVNTLQINAAKNMIINYLNNTNDNQGAIELERNANIKEVKLKFY